MKKSAIILTLCMAFVLVGCGKTEKNSTSRNPLDIQKATGDVTASKNPELEIPSEFQTKTPAETESSTKNAEIATTVSGSTSNSGTLVTQTRTAAVNLVRRTTVAVPNIPPSRGTVDRKSVV